jgi:hypothetical protein
VAAVASHSLMLLNMLRQSACWSADAESKRSTVSGLNFPQ